MSVKEWYLDWKQDHIDELREGFCEMMEEDFDKYCLDACHEDMVRHV